VVVPLSFSTAIPLGSTNLLTFHILFLWLFMALNTLLSRKSLALFMNHFTNILTVQNPLFLNAHLFLIRCFMALGLYIWFCLSVRFILQLLIMLR